MVLAWYINDSCENQKLPNHRSPPNYVSLSSLRKVTGVEYYKVDGDQPENDSFLIELKNTRGYSFNDDVICTEQSIQNQTEILHKYYTEHLHTHEEIRLVLDGSGYFDVRDAKNEWIRIHVQLGDLIIIPAGLYHRFTLDDKNFTKIKRFFIGGPIWTQHNRPADEMDCRKIYLKNLQNEFAEA